VASFDRRLAILRPNKVLRALALVPFGLFLAAIILGTSRAIPNAGAFVMGVHGVIWTLLAIVVTWFKNPWPRKSHAQVTADATGIKLDGKDAIARRDIVSAYMQPRAGDLPVVRFVTRGRRVLLEACVEGETEGRALLEAVELDVAHHAMTFRGASPTMATTPRQMLFSIGAAMSVFMLTFLTAILGPIAPAVIVPLVVLLAMPSSIQIGADGIVTRWLAWKRFIAYADVHYVVPFDNGLQLVLKSGKSINVATSPPSRGGQLRVSDYVQRRDAVYARIQEALAAHRAGRGALDVGALVARGGRAASDWLRAVRAIATGAAGGDYRAPAIPEESLWRVAEDPAAEETARVGAAMALRVALDDAGRGRLRAVADASVSPKVRIALEAAAGAENDDALLEAMSAYEGNEPSR
jgi:hypothetical protein